MFAVAVSLYSKFSGDTRPQDLTSTLFICSDRKTAENRALGAIVSMCSSTDSITDNEPFKVLFDDIGCCSYEDFLELPFDKRIKIVVDLMHGGDDEEAYANVEIKEIKD